MKHSSNCTQDERDVSVWQVNKKHVLFGSQFPYAFLFGSLFTNSSAPEIVVVWGANPGESQPLNLMRPIRDAKEKGALLVAKPDTFQRDHEMGTNPSVYYRPPQKPRGL